MPTSATDPSPPEHDMSLSDKQERVRRVLWHCLKNPPRVEVTVGPGELSVAAKFTTTSVGVHFGDVQTGSEEIVVAAKLDPATVEVNLEQLGDLAELDSAEEASLVCDSIKQQVGAVPPACERTDTAHETQDSPEHKLLAADRDQPVIDATSLVQGIAEAPPRTAESDTEPAPPLTTGVPASETPEPKPTEKSDLYQRLLTAAVDVRLAALKARLSKCEHDYEVAGSKAASQDFSAYRYDHSRNVETIRTKEELKEAKSDLEIASIHGSTNFKKTTAWFVHQLIGDVGIQNLHQCFRSLNRTDQSDVLQVAIDNEDASLSLMDKVPKAYLTLAENGQSLKNTYHERYRRYGYFCEQHHALWSKFFTAGSTERNLLLFHSQNEGLVTYSEELERSIGCNRIARLAWKWIEKITGQTSHSIESELWIGRYLKAMRQVLGDGIMCFMDKRLEIRLRGLFGGRGILASFIKTVEVMVGKELRHICEKVQTAISHRSAEPDNVLHHIGEQLQTITERHSSSGVSNVATLLGDIEHGRVIVAMRIEDEDEEEIADNELDNVDVQESGDKDGENDIGSVSGTPLAKSTRHAGKTSSYSNRGDRFGDQDKTDSQVPTSKNGKKKRQGSNRDEHDTPEAKKQKKKKKAIAPTQAPKRTPKKGSKKGLK